RSASVRTGQSSSGARCGEERQPSPMAITPSKLLYFRGIPMTEPAAHAERLPRTLGVWSAAFILVGITIGSGIFRVPAQIAVTLGSPGAFLLVWVIGGLITLAGALTIAELAAMYPRSGGILAYIAEAWGPFPAFVYGWAELTVIRASAVGGISMIFAEYLGHFIPMSDATESYVAAVTI